MDSSINTGLAAIPDLTDISSPLKLNFQFIQIYNAIGILQQAIDSYTGNTPSGSSSSNSTPEQTILVGNTSNMWCTAGVALSAGYLVTLYNQGGATYAKLAQAEALTTAGFGTNAMGITMGAAAAGSQVQVLLFGLFNFGGSIIPGQQYYTSPFNAGYILGPSAMTPGEPTQPIGFGVDTNSIFFNPSQIIGTWP